ncbi:hypothetical protein Tco_0026191 [Tanacetum coccineum]
MYNTIALMRRDHAEDQTVCIGHLTFAPHRIMMKHMDIEADEDDQDDKMMSVIGRGGGGGHLAPAYPDSIPEPLPVIAWSDSEVARLLAISSPPASPLSPWSSSPPQIPFPLSPPQIPLPLSPPSPVLTALPPSPIRSLGYRALDSRD